MSINEEANAKLNNAISILITFRPLFGLVFLYLNKRENMALPTIAVGTIRQVDLALYYNPEFVNKLTYKELQAVLIHEAMHVLLHHIVRSIHYNYGIKGFNIAADIAINCSIPNLPPGGLYPKTFNLPDHEAAEWYYRKLKEEAEKNGENFLDGKGDLIDDHSMWGECEEDVIAEKIRNIAGAAIKEQEKKGWGDIAGEVVAKVLAANRPTVNWKKEVRYFINKLVLHGYKPTRSRLNRREQSLMKDRVPELRDIYINPGKRKHYTSRLLIGIDTSGSVSDNELKEFVDEINGMIDHVEVDYLCFDTQIYGPPKVFNKKVKVLEIKGRGGTCFEPIIKYVDEHFYDGLIVMTDGRAPFPQKPRARVMWCLTKSGGSIEPPFGKKVVIDVKEK